MSFWMELRCDAAHDGCCTANSRQMPNGRYANVIAGSTALTKLSEEWGWTFVKGLGHVCPKCKERRDATN